MGGNNVMGGANSFLAAQTSMFQQALQQQQQALQQQQQMAGYGGGDAYAAQQGYPAQPPVQAGDSSLVGPQQAMGVNGAIGVRLVTGFPPIDQPTGRKIQALEGVPGHVKHDMLVPKGQVGRLIGQGGATYKELQVKTSCNIFVLDKEGPPSGFGVEQRVVVLVGTPSAVTLASHQVLDTLQGPATAPPPMVGGVGMKRGADDDDYEAKRARN